MSRAAGQAAEWGVDRLRMPEPLPPGGPDKPRQVRAMFARIASRYDRMNALMTLGRDRGWRRLAVRVARIPPDARVLDVGAGTADLAIEAAAHAAPRIVVALDLTPEMLLEGRLKARATGLVPPTTFVVGDAQTLPFPDASFDAILTGFTMRNVADLERALTELRRVLVPGGTAAILELTPLHIPVVSQVFRAYFHNVVPLLGRIVAGDSAAYTYLPRSVDIFPTAERLAHLLSLAGFARIRYRRLMFGTVALHLATTPGRAVAG